MQTAKNIERKNNQKEKAHLSAKEEGRRRLGNRTRVLALAGRGKVPGLTERYSDH